MSYWQVEPPPAQAHNSQLLNRVGTLHADVCGPIQTMGNDEEIYIYDHLYRYLLKLYLRVSNGLLDTHTEATAKHFRVRWSTDLTLPTNYLRLQFCLVYRQRRENENEYCQGSSPHHHYIYL